MITNSTVRKSQYVGGLFAAGNSCTIVNVNSKVNINVTNTQTVAMAGIIGGIGGYMINGKIYKSSWNGTIYFKCSTDSTTANHNNMFAIAGIVGQADGAITIDTCFVTGTITGENSSGMMGGVCGLPSGDPNKYVMIFKDILLNVKMISKGPGHFNDIGMLFGEEPGYGGGLTKTNENGSTISNVYIVGGGVSAGATGTEKYNNLPVLFGFEQNMTQEGINSYYSKIVYPTTGTVYPSKANAATGNVKKASVAEVVTEANKNQNITNNFTISSNGAVSGKLSAPCRPHPAPLRSGGGGAFRDLYILSNIYNYTYKLVYV